MRYLPPVYSPLAARAIVGALGGGALGRDSARSELVQHLSERFSTTSVVVTGSGTQALQLAMEVAPSFGRGPAVVALPAYSCFDLVSAAVGAGVQVRFYDVDPLTLSPDIEHLRTVMSEGVSAVVAGNLYGYPLDWEAIRAECSRQGVFLIEDAAQGVGSGGDGVGGGRFGDVSVLSFGRGKGWTGGGGGALLVHRLPEGDDIASQTSCGPSGFGLRSAMVTTVAWLLGRPSLYGVPASMPSLGLGETVYKDPTPPHQISGFSAALAKRTAASATAAIASRRSVADRWTAALRVHASSVSLCSPIGGARNASFLRYAVVLSDSGDVPRLIEPTRRVGAARGYPTALDRLPQSDRVRVGPSRRGLPGADRLATRLVTLPTHQWVTQRDIEAVSHEVSRTNR